MYSTVTRGVCSMEGLSCLLLEEEGSPSISDILLLNLALQEHDISFKKSDRDALRWPLNMDKDHESLLAQVTDSPYRSAAWTKRNPEPIFPIQRIYDEKDQSPDLIGDDDSEIEEATEKRQSPWTPLQHSPILYEAIVQRIATKTDADLDPILQRTIALGVMRKLETLLDRVRIVQEHCVKPPLDVPFVLNISKSILTEEQVIRVQERYTSIIDLSKNLHDHKES